MKTKIKFWLQTDNILNNTMFIIFRKKLMATVSRQWSNNPRSLSMWFMENKLIHVGRWHRLGGILKISTYPPIWAHHQWERLIEPSVVTFPVQHRPSKSIQFGRILLIQTKIQAFYIGCLLYPQQLVICHVVRIHTIMALSTISKKAIPFQHTDIKEGEKHFYMGLIAEMDFWIHYTEIDFLGKIFLLVP